MVRGVDSPVGWRVVGQQDRRFRGPDHSGRLAPPAPQAVRADTRRP
jgi:hypothetical protein